MNNKVQEVKFNINGNEITVSNYAELDGKKGIINGEGMAFFWGEGRAFYVGNTRTGILRQFSSVDGYMLIDDRHIDYNAISRACRHGFMNAVNKSIKYAALNRYNGFEKGICAISWMLYPDGRYFADSDGFGMEDNNEENVYAVIDSNLDIIAPFRPIEDVTTLLKDMRSKKKRIFNLVIIDESGSMQSIKKEAIDSVNETIQTIRAAQKKHTEQEQFVSVVTFNDDVKHVVDCVSVNDVKELSDETYIPARCTALYDAMGISINNLRRKVKEDDTVLVTVVTDGYENASHEYNGNAIKALVDEMKAKGWIFAYIGANQDVEAVAAHISITNVLNFEASAVGTKVMSEKLASARAHVYDSIADNSFCSSVANKEFFD